MRIFYEGRDRLFSLFPNNYFCRYNAYAIHLLQLSPSLVRGAIYSTKLPKVNRVNSP